MKSLNENDEINNPLFGSLLYHPNDYVKFHAAFSLLHVNEQLAKTVLQSLSEKEGVIGFEAQMSLSEFEKENI